jgi:hypothetical protein
MGCFAKQYLKEFRGKIKYNADDWHPKNFATLVLL